MIQVYSKIMMLSGGAFLVGYGFIGIQSFSVKRAHLIGSVCGDRPPSDLSPFIGNCDDYCFMVITGCVILAANFFSDRVFRKKWLDFSGRLTVSINFIDGGVQ